MTDIVLWVFSDGRKGHEKQTTGLTQAMDRLTSQKIVVHRILVGTPLGILRQLPQPDLLIGAGNGTHFPMLVVKLLFGARSVVLMKPSLPTIFFDLIFLPHHDTCTNFGNVYTTDGVLCPIPNVRPENECGVILLGGASRHFQWDTDAVQTAVQNICSSNPRIHWTICDSPRSPENLLTQLSNVANATTRHWRTTNETFLTDLLNLSSQTWVTSDSVTMLYEALNTGSPVGIIDLPLKRKMSKLSRGMYELVKRERVHLASEGYSINKDLSTTPAGEEALRCALICLKLLKHEPVS